MKRAWTLAAVAVVMALTTALVFADQEQSSVIFARSRTVKYSPLVPGVSSSVVWGDTARGPFGGFTRFRPGFDAGMHTHTADVLVVVLRGAYLYRDDAGAKRVGLGDFIRIPGGHKHWSGGDRKEGALFYQETLDRKSTRLNSSHLVISYAVFCLKKKKKKKQVVIIGDIMNKRY